MPLRFPFGTDFEGVEFYGIWKLAYANALVVAAPGLLARVFDYQLVPLAVLFALGMLVVPAQLLLESKIPTRVRLWRFAIGIGASICFFALMLPRAQSYFDSGLLWYCSAALVLILYMGVDAGIAGAYRRDT